MIALAARNVANAAAHFRRRAAVGRPTCQLQFQCRARPLAASHAWLPSPAIRSYRWPEVASSSYLRILTCGSVDVSALCGGT